MKKEKGLSLKKEKNHDKAIMSAAIKKWWGKI